MPSIHTGQGLPVQGAGGGGSIGTNASQGYGSNAAANYGNTYVYNTAGSSYSMSVSYDSDVAEPVPVPPSDLPELMMEGYDDNNDIVKIFLKPEANISSSECMKILMMVVAVTQGGSFNPYGYIKKNNLERHFTYK